VRPNAYRDPRLGRAARPFSPSPVSFGRMDFDRTPAEDLVFPQTYTLPSDITFLLWSAFEITITAVLVRAGDPDAVPPPRLHLGKLVPPPSRCLACACLCFARLSRPIHDPFHIAQTPNTIVSFVLVLPSGRHDHHSRTD